MCMKREHYHCSLCGEIYYSTEEAENCFWNHSEREILRWVGFVLVSMRHFAADAETSQRTCEVQFLCDFIDKLNEKFKVAEIDENGGVWSLAIEGKRL